MSKIKVIIRPTENSYEVFTDIDRIPTIDERSEIARRIEACWNAFIKVDTETIEACGDVLAYNVNHGSAQSRAIKTLNFEVGFTMGQRDNLLDALRKISSNSAENPEWIKRVADEAIAKVGGAA